ncbi:MAG: hypothetical protein ACYDDF_06990 [Thermoplasmatota archaeon]
MNRAARIETVASTTVLWVVPGLLAEGHRVALELERLSGIREIILGVSAAEVRGLEDYLEKGPSGDDEAVSLADPYAAGLSMYGAVAYPPPAYIEAVRFAKRHGALLHGVDLGEEDYDDHFVERVSTWEWWRHGRRMRRMERRPPKAATAEEFALLWDQRLRKTGKGIRSVEAEREKKLVAALRTGDPVPAPSTRVAVLDVVMREGVLERLRENPAAVP